MVYLDKRTVMKVLRNTYIEFYGERPERFNEEMQISEHLHVDGGIGRPFALGWLREAALELKIPESKLPKPKERDYTLKEIADIFLGT